MKAIIPIINHLIRQNVQTQTAMRAFAGKTVHLHAAGIHIHAAINGEGLWKHTSNTADTEIYFLARAVQKILQGQTPGVGDILIDGDTESGMALLQLLGNLHYNADHDLSRLFGEASAKNIVTRTQNTATALKKIGQDLLEGLGDFAKEPEAAVVDKYTLSTWLHSVDTLRDDTARLQARIEKLEHRLYQTTAN